MGTGDTIVVALDNGYLVVIETASVRIRCQYIVRILYRSPTACAVAAPLNLDVRKADAFHRFTRLCISIDAELTAGIGDG